MTQTDNEIDYEADYGAGFKAGRRAERNRIQSIMGLPEAQNLPELAAELAFKNGDTVQSVQQALKSALAHSSGASAQRREAHAIGAHYSVEELAEALSGQASSSKGSQTRLPAPNQAGAVSYSDIHDQLAAERDDARPKQAGALSADELAAAMNAEKGFDPAKRR